MMSYDPREPSYEQIHREMLEWVEAGRPSPHRNRVLRSPEVQAASDEIATATERTLRLIFNEHRETIETFGAQLADVCAAALIDSANAGEIARTR